MDDNNILFGYRAKSEFNNCIVIGDDCEAKFDGDVVVGITLFGKYIDDAMQDFILENPCTFRNFVEAMWSPMIEFSNRVKKINKELEKLND